MASFRERGKTFLRVSHALAEVVDSCQRAIWISEGSVVNDGPAGDVCAAYLAWAQGGAPA